MLGMCALTLFLCTQNFKANGVNRFIIRACARLQARKTCFQRFGPNSLSFYRIKLIFSFFWDAEKNGKQSACLCSSPTASFAVAGVFTYPSITNVIYIKYQVSFSQGGGEHLFCIFVYCRYDQHYNCKLYKEYFGIAGLNLLNMSIKI